MINSSGLSPRTLPEAVKDGYNTSRKGGAGMGCLRGLAGCTVLPNVTLHRLQSHNLGHVMCGSRRAGMRDTDEAFM